MALVFPPYESGYDAYSPHSMSRRPSMYGGSSYAYDHGGYHDPTMYGGVRRFNHGPFDLSDILVAQQYTPHHDMYGYPATVAPLMGPSTLIFFSQLS